MPRFLMPNSASLHTAKSFIERNDPFRNDGSDEATLELDDRWVHVEPLALSMVAAWGAWCRDQGYQIRIQNPERAAYLYRMRLFDHLGVDWNPGIREHEEAGRFLPITQVRAASEVASVVGDISALLHLQEDPESLSAVQYCVSELIRNVLEHSESGQGAFVSAHRYVHGDRPRVTIGVADCGQGIGSHLGRVHPEAATDDAVALRLAMRPGITGARAGQYGAPDNAGAGLFITRCMAKGTGGYFFLMSGNAAYRLLRGRREDEMTELFLDPLAEPRHNLWRFAWEWPGTAVSVEIRTEKIGEYEGFFQWIFRQVPRRETKRGRIKFT